MQMLRYLLAAAGDYSDSADDGDEAAPLKKRAAAAGSMEMGSLQADTWCSSSVSRCCALYYPKLASMGVTILFIVSGGPKDCSFLLRHSHPVHCMNFQMTVGSTLLRHMIHALYFAPRGDK